MEERGPAAYIAELVGTFLLVLFIALIVSVASTPVPASRRPEFAVIGLLHAFLLMMLIQTLGGASGAHFNPAVTLGLLSVRKIRPNEAAIYIAMQVVGAIAGAAVCKLILSELLVGPNLGNPSVSPTLLHGKTLLGALCRAGRHLRPGLGDHGGRREPARKRRLGGLRDRRHARLRRAGVRTPDRRRPEPGARARPCDRGQQFIGGFGKFAVVYIVGPVIGGLLAALGYKLLVLDPAERVGERPIDKLA